MSIVSNKPKRISYKDPNYRWSFSSITSYLECPYMFKLHYIDDVEDAGNAFSDYGMFAHEILEKWAKEELMDFELADYYSENYATAMRHDYPPFPITMPQNAYDAGEKYFMEFVGFGSEFEIVSAEQKFATHVGPYKFGGISDLVLRNKENGTYVVIDHKTKSPVSMKKELDLYTKQLYIYARHVYETHGEFPSLMAFNMIKGQNLILEKFDIDKYDATMLWIIESVEKILAETKWDIGGSSYFCQNICSYRNSCEFSDRFKTEWALKQEKKRVEADRVVDTMFGGM